jgi:hypothetical protein
LSEEDKSPRKAIAVLNISTEPTQANPEADHAAPRKTSLKRYVLEKLRTWANSLLEAERDEFLGRGRHQPLDEKHDNYRNGYRPRTINLLFRAGGGGAAGASGPPRRIRVAVAAGTEGSGCGVGGFLSGGFSGGLVQARPARISEKHLGQKYDSKQVSRIVARATTEL